VRFPVVGVDSGRSIEVSGIDRSLYTVVVVALVVRLTSGDILGVVGDLVGDISYGFPKAEFSKDLVLEAAVETEADSYRVS
jgi:hypothetical protein